MRRSRFTASSNTSQIQRLDQCDEGIQIMLAYTLTVNSQYAVHSYRVIYTQTPCIYTILRFTLMCNDDSLIKTISHVGSDSVLKLLSGC